MAERWQEQYRHLTGPGGSVEVVELSRWSGSEGVQPARGFACAEGLA